jgi:exodeoxyribonuclease V alpha subunit
MTIHRLLGYNGREYAKGPDHPIDADVLIIDEFSMTDVTLAWRLFRAIDLSRTSVVLVGDHNQLPPVGPGNILLDNLKDPMSVSGRLLDIAQNVLEERLKFDLLRDVQILAPTHKGPLGTLALNEGLQRLVQRKRFGVEVPPHVPGRRTPLVAHPQQCQQSRL